MHGLAHTRRPRNDQQKPNDRIVSNNRTLWGFRLRNINRVEYSKYPITVPDLL